MSNRGEKAREIKTLKAVALRRRMAEKKLTEGKTASACGLTTRDAVTQWKSGKSWPYPAGEKILEQALDVPQGFFAKIAAGMPYEEAIKPTDEDARHRIAEEEEAHLGLSELFDRGDDDLRQHIVRQIRLLRKARFPAKQRIERQG